MLISRVRSIVIKGYRKCEVYLDYRDVDNGIFGVTVINVTLFCDVKLCL